MVVVVRCSVVFMHDPTKKIVLLVVETSYANVEEEQQSGVTFNYRRQLKAHIMLLLLLL